MVAEAPLYRGYASGSEAVPAAPKIAWVNDKRNARDLLLSGTVYPRHVAVRDWEYLGEGLNSGRLETCYYAHLGATILPAAELFRLQVKGLRRMPTREECVDRLRGTGVSVPSHWASLYSQELDLIRTALNSRRSTGYRHCPDLGGWIVWRTDHWESLPTDVGGYLAIHDLELIAPNTSARKRLEKAARIALHLSIDDFDPGQV